MTRAIMLWCVAAAVTGSRASERVAPLRLTPAAIRLGHAAVDTPAPYTVRFFQQRIDHFRSDQRSAHLWQQKYLINKEHWGGPGHPILFYTGNEAAIEGFYGASGFMTQVLAPRLKGLLVFAEQRFYGASLPFGKAGSFTPGALSLLSTEQVLADYANLITSLKLELNASTSPVVAFGGSYGGTLSTLMRVKYPHIVVGALAASAPLGYYSPSHWKARGVDELTWFRTVERVYTEARAGCYAALVRGVRLANATARSADTKERAALAATFNLCAPPTEVDAFVYWITEALESIPQIDYPYAVGSLPPNPVNATCDAVREGLSDRALLAALSNTTLTFYAGSLTDDLADDHEFAADRDDGRKCIPESLARNNQVGGGTPGDGPEAASSWGYQSCTETLHAFSVPHGSWRAYNFSLGAISALCRRYYNVTPRTHWLETWSGGYAISDAGAGHSNVIWTNGRRDPWHGGGFLRDSDALPGGAVFVMEHTAHHQDLRAPHNADPPELKKVREREEAIIRGWLSVTPGAA